MSRCAKCVEFDAETKAIAGKLFSQDELTLLTLTMAQAISMRTEMLNQVQGNDVKRIAMRRDIDFAGQMMGKIVVGLDDLYKLKLVKALKSVGIFLDVSHAPCPHDVVAVGYEGRPLYDPKHDLGTPKDPA